MSDDPVIQQLNQALLNSIPNIMAKVSEYLVSTALNGPSKIRNEMTHHSPTLSEQRAADKVGITAPPLPQSVFCDMVVFLMRRLRDALGRILRRKSEDGRPVES